MDPVRRLGFSNKPRSLKKRKEEPIVAHISDFKSQLATSGARSNQFRVQITFPSILPNAALAGQKLQFLAKSAQLPSSTVGDIQVMYRGRPVHFAGEREFEPWSIEVYNDNDFIVRNAFESWVDTMANSDTTHGAMYTQIYQVDMQVQQLDRNDRIVKEYTFHDAFPLTVGQIQLDWDASNQIEIFPVTFQYNYFTSETGNGVLVA